MGVFTLCLTITKPVPMPYVNRVNSKRKQRASVKPRRRWWQEKSSSRARRLVREGGMVIMVAMVLERKKCCVEGNDLGT